MPAVRVEQSLFNGTAQKREPLAAVVGLAPEDTAMLPDFAVPHGEGVLDVDLALPGLAGLTTHTVAADLHCVIAESLVLR